MTVLIEMAVQSSVFILLLVLIRPWIKRTLNAGLGYALWLIPLARLLVPFSITTPYSLLGYLMEGRTAALPPLTQTVDALTAGAGQSVSAAGKISVAALPAAEAVLIPQAAQNLRWESVLPAVWAAGVLAALIFMMISNARFRRAAGNRKRLMGWGYSLPIYVVDALPSPCLSGVVRPSILLPPSVIRSEQMLDMVLLHEMTHYKRGDHVWTVLRALTLCLWWWNPLVWLAVKLSREDCELACDEAVVSGMDSLGREAYGMSLIALVRKDSALAFPLQLGASMSSGRKQMEERINMIVAKRKKLGPAGLCLMVCIALMMPLVFTGSVAAAPAARADVHVGDLPDLPKPKGPLNEAEEIELAKLWLLGHIVHDDGYAGFEEKAKVSPGTLAWNGEDLPVDTVELRVFTHSNLHYSYEVSIHRESGRVVCMKSNEIEWIDTRFSAHSAADLNRVAYVRHPAELAVSLQDWIYPGNYGFAKEQLMNGTEVTINQILGPMEDLHPSYPEELRGEWARITVAANSLFEGAKGFVPLNFLSQTRETAYAPVEGALQSVSGKAVALRADTGLTDRSPASFPVDTRARVLGQTKDYYHVQVGESVGFVPAGALRFDEQANKTLAQAQPRAYGDVQPGWEGRYEEYSFKRNIQYNRYGDANGWTLEQSAQGSELARVYGFVWQGDRVHIMPDLEGMQEGEAIVKAKAYAQEGFGIKADDVREIWASFYYPSESPDEKIWKISLRVKAPGSDCAIFMDAQGELIKTWKSPVLNHPENEEEGALSPDELGYYLYPYHVRDAEPMERDLTEQEAVAKAEAIFNREYSQSRLRSYSVKAGFQQNRQRTLRWWAVEFNDQDEKYAGLPYNVILIAPDGSEYYHTDHYRENVEEADLWARIAEMEKEKGLFITWSVEDKTAAEPRFYELPGKDHLSKDEALAHAVSYLKERHGLSEARLSGFTPYYSFEAGQRWRVDFLDEVSAGGDYAQGESFAVVMDAVSGELIDIIWSNDPNSHG